MVFSEGAFSPHGGLDGFPFADERFGARLHVAVLDALLWYAEGDPGSAFVKVALEINHALPRTVDGTYRYDAFIVKFRPEGLIRIRRCILSLDCSFKHRYLSGDRITAWNARVFNFGTCLELRVADGGGVSMHGDRSKPGSAVDLFAGIGGWSFGDQLVRQCGGSFLPPLRFALEWDPVTARVCAANLNAVVLGEGDLRDPHFEWPVDVTVVLNVDVDSLVYRDLVSRCNILLVVGSPSCQPWSRGSHALGFGHKFGLHTISFLSVATLYMPPFIVLENVLGLLKHVHWRWIEKLFGLCGYEMIAGISEGGPILPVCRDRSVVIFGRMDNPVSEFVKETIPRMRLTCERERTLHAWSVVDPSCRQFAGHELALSKEQVGIILDAGLLPIWMRNPFLGAQDVLAVRCVNRDLPLAPIMASYGKNISFQRDYLVKKGLFLQVVRSGTDLRLLSPCELAIAMGFPSGLFLSQDLTEAFQMLGNCFTPIHAAQALTRVALCFHYPFPVEDFPLSASATVQLLLHGSLRTGCVIECSEGLVRLTNVRDTGSNGAAPSDGHGTLPGVSGPGRRQVAFNEISVGKPSPPCLDVDVAPNVDLGDLTETPAGEGDVLGTSTPLTGNLGCVRTCRFDRRDEPFPTISSTVPFSAEKGHSHVTFGDEQGHTCIHVISDGVQVSQLSVPSGTSVGTIHSVAEVLWGSKTDLPSMSSRIGDVADGAGRIFTHLVGPDSGASGISGEGISVFVRDPAGFLQLTRVGANFSFADIARLVGHRDVSMIKALCRGLPQEMDSRACDICSDGDEVLFSFRTRGGSIGEGAVVDHWNVRHFDHGSLFMPLLHLVRVNIEPRTSLFHPGSVQLPPGFVIDFVQPRRITIVVPVGRRHESFQHEDSWTTTDIRDGFPFLWTGFTEFFFQTPPQPHGPPRELLAIDGGDVWGEPFEDDAEDGVIIEDQDFAEDLSNAGSAGGYSDVEFFEVPIEDPPSGSVARSEEGSDLPDLEDIVESLVCDQVLARTVHGSLIAVPVSSETTFGAVAEQAGFVELENIKASCQGHVHELSVDVRRAGISRDSEVVFTHRHLGGAKGFDLENTDSVLQQAVSKLHSIGAGQVDASNFIRKCNAETGPGRIARFVNENDLQKQLKILHGISSAASIPVPKGVSVVKQTAKATMQVRADSFRLDPGRFLAQDGSRLEVLSEISACAPPGVVLLDGEQAQGWLTTVNLVKHELVMVVLGGCSGLNCDVTYLPAFNLQGEPVILRVCVHQLGSVKSKTLDHKATIATSPHCVIAFHIYMEDFPPEGWSKITAAPVKEVALRFSEGSAMFISPPWSRQWLNDRKSIAKERATHVSFIARVYKRSVVSLYRQSGHNSVFVNPLRTGNEKPDEICSVIWMGEDRQLVAQTALKRQEQLGLVRSWKKGFGIRVLTSEFDAVFTEIKPGEEKPDLKGGDKIFRAQPLPPAMTLADVREWLGKVAWKAAPIKLLGGGSVIISAEEGPSSTFLPLNDGFVLVKEIRSKARRDPSSVAAGRWSAPEQPGIDPLVAHDPWAAAKRGTGSSLVAAPPQDHGKIDKHDRQIIDIQTALKELQDNQSKVAGESAAFRKEVTAEITGFQHRITHEVKSIAGVFSQSLQDALSKQETRFDHRFEEMKSLLQGIGGGRPAKRLAREAESERMED